MKPGFAWIGGLCASQAPLGCWCCWRTAIKAGSYATRIVQYVKRAVTCVKQRFCFGICMCCVPVPPLHRLGTLWSTVSRPSSTSDANTSIGLLLGTIEPLRFHMELGGVYGCSCPDSMLEFGLEIDPIPATFRFNLDYLNPHSKVADEAREPREWVLVSAEYAD